MNRKAALLATAVLSGFSFGHAFAEIGQGGCSVYHSGEYTVHVFRQNGTFTFDGSRNVDVLLVGGGGAGGAFHGGGGGGGGVLVLPGASLSKGTYQIVVGHGGDGSQTELANRAGGSTAVKSGDEVVWTAPGGGGGGFRSVGGDGASGGGGGIYTGIQERAGGNGQEGFGFAGGKGIGVHETSQFWRWGGGGGGAGERGGDAWREGESETDCGAGKGGDGRYCDFSGTNVCYGGGGGGGSNGRPNTNPRIGAVGGNGGGGTGGGYEPKDNANTPYRGSDGTDGLGGGGGGGGSYSGTSADGGNGGSGIVILRYRSDFKSAFDKVAATGGKLNRIESDMFVCTFTNNGSFTVSGNSYVDVLLVGGGGGGGANHGGGGGGGGVMIANTVALYSGTYTIEVGEGGIPGWANYSVDYLSGGNGGDTKVDFGYVAFTAYGGGGGATPIMSHERAITGNDGASGGGGSVYASKNEGVQVSAKGGACIPGQGYEGGIGYSSKTGQFWQWGGGGGGAGEAGGNAWYASDTECGAGKGGDGRCCDFSGANVYYGGGGGGGSNGRPNDNPRTGAPGGLGGGGTGAGYEPSQQHAIEQFKAYCGENGADGLGGGGGGGGSYDKNFGLGGKGGCGAVIIRFRRNEQGMILKLK